MRFSNSFGYHPRTCLVCGGDGLYSIDIVPESVYLYSDCDRYGKSHYRVVLCRDDYFLYTNIPNVPRMKTYLKKVQRSFR